MTRLLRRTHRHGHAEACCGGTAAGASGRWLRRGAVALVVASAAVGLPAQATTFTVTTLEDSGVGSLRQAVTNAANAPGADVITFAPALSGKSIHLTRTLEIGSDVRVDGDLDRDGLPNVTLVQDTPEHSVLAVYSGEVTVRGLVLTGGHTTTVNGGAIHNSASLRLENSIIRGNSAGYPGGGIANFGVLSVSNSTISGNTAASEGGGIFNIGVLSVSNSTISGNTAEYGAGGISNLEIASIVNSTISGNVVDGIGGRGGGINNGPTSRLTVRSSTISGNSSQVGGGIHNSAPVGDTVIEGSVITGNALSECAAVAPTSGGYNVFGDASCGAGLPTDRMNVPAADALVTDLAGAPVLADNGGLTMTIALRQGVANPAVDLIPAVNCPVASDQRGIPRPQGPGCDAGAHERIPSTVKDLTVTAPSRLVVRWRPVYLTVRVVGPFSTSYHRASIRLENTTTGATIASTTARDGAQSVQLNVPTTLVVPGRHRVYVHDAITPTHRALTVGSGDTLTVKWGSVSSVTATRSGSDVTLRAASRRYAPTYATWLPNRSARVWFQVRTSTGSWITKAYGTTTWSGTATARIHRPTTSTWRVVVKDTASVWGSTSPSVRR